MSGNNFSNCTNSLPPNHYPLIITTDVPATLYNRMIEQKDNDFGPYKENFVLVTQPDTDVHVGLQKEEEDLVSGLKDLKADQLGDVSIRLLGDYGLDKRSGRVTDRLFVVIDQGSVRDDGYSVRVVQWQTEVGDPTERRPPPRWVTARIEWEWALQWLASLSYKRLVEAKADHGDNDVLEF